MYNTAVTGFEYMKEFGFENITVPKQTYAVFTTENQSYPVEDYFDIRKRIVSSGCPQIILKLQTRPKFLFITGFRK